MPRMRSQHAKLLKSEKYSLRGWKNFALPGFWGPWQALKSRKSLKVVPYPVVKAYDKIPSVIGGALTILAFKTI